MEAYRPRTIRPLEPWSWNGWRMKVYELSASGGPVASGLHQAAKGRAAELLGTVARRTAHYSIGFIGVHAGCGGDVVFVDWWAAENELHHHLYLADPGHPETLRPRRETELAACVHDLAVMAFEREVWIRCVLDRPENPSWDEYLSCVLERDG